MDIDDGPTGGSADSDDEDRGQKRARDADGHEEEPSAKRLKLGENDADKVGDADAPDAPADPPSGNHFELLPDELVEFLFYWLLALDPLPLWKTVFRLSEVDRRFTVIGAPARKTHRLLRDIEDTDREPDLSEEDFDPEFALHMGYWNRSSRLPRQYRVLVMQALAKKTANTPTLERLAPLFLSWIKSLTGTSGLQPLVESLHDMVLSSRGSGKGISAASTENHFTAARKAWPVQQAKLADVEQKLQQLSAEATLPDARALLIGFLADTLPAHSLDERDTLWDKLVVAFDLLPAGKLAVVSLTFMTLHVGCLSNAPKRASAFAWIKGKLDKFSKPVASPVWHGLVETGLSDLQSEERATLCNPLVESVMKHPIDNVELLQACGAFLKTLAPEERARRFEALFALEMPKQNIQRAFRIAALSGWIEFLAPARRGACLSQIVRPFNVVWGATAVGGPVQLVPTVEATAMQLVDQAHALSPQQIEEHTTTYMSLIGTAFIYTTHAPQLLDTFLSHAAADANEQVVANVFVRVLNELDTLMKNAAQVPATLPRNATMSASCHAVIASCLPLLPDAAFATASRALIANLRALLALGAPSSDKFLRAMSRSVDLVVRFLRRRGETLLDEALSCLKGSWEIASSLCRIGDEYIDTELHCRLANLIPMLPDEDQSAHIDALLKTQSKYRRGHGGPLLALFTMALTLKNPQNRVKACLLFKSFLRSKTARGYFKHEYDIWQGMTQYLEMLEDTLPQELIADYHSQRDAQAAAEPVAGSDDDDMQDDSEGHSDDDSDE